MKIMPDFGNVCENDSTYHIAMMYITEGDVEWGHHILTELRDHLWRLKENKSILWVLPRVLEALADLEMCDPLPATWHMITTTPYKEARSGRVYSGHLSPIFAD